MITKYLCKPVMWSGQLKNANSLQRSNVLHRHYLTSSSLASKVGWLTGYYKDRPSQCNHCLRYLPCLPSRHKAYASVHTSQNNHNGQFSVPKRTGISNTGITEDTDPISHKTKGIADTGWMVRLANENGYLSWCRNTYLATVIGVAMWAEGPSAVALYGAEGAFFVGGLNLMCGTMSYINTILRLRKQLHMSFMGAGLHVLGAVSHILLWITIVVTYLGHVEAEKENKLKAQNPGQENHPGEIRK